MSIMAVDDVLADLQDALQKLDESYAEQREKLVAAIRAFGGTVDDAPATPSPTPSGRRLTTPEGLGAIGDDKLQGIRAFVLAHPNGVRQADITQKVRVGGRPLNSGTVSVGLAHLAHEGLVECHGKVEGSNFWVLKPQDSAPPLHAAAALAS